MILFEMKFVVLVEVASNSWKLGVLYLHKVKLFVFMDSIDEKKVTRWQSWSPYIPFVATCHFLKNSKEKATLPRGRTGNLTRGSRVHHAGPKL
jgi:hypothetical protein